MNCNPESTPTPRTVADSVLTGKGALNVTLAADDAEGTVTSTSAVLAGFGWHLLNVAEDAGAFLTTCWDDDGLVDASLTGICVEEGGRGGGTRTGTPDGKATCAGGGCSW
jgi:hypothetical protein